MVDYSQKDIDGNVTVELYKGNVLARGRSSSKSLYDADLASMDEQGAFEGLFCFLLLVQLVATLDEKRYAAQRERFVVLWRPFSMDFLQIGCVDCLWW